MKATIIGMLVCVLAAAVVMVAVALPRLRQGARVLTPAGREQVTDARRRAMALAAQAKERAAVVAEQAKERTVGEQSDAPTDVQTDVRRVELDQLEPAVVTASRVEQSGAGQASAPPSPRTDVVDVRAAEVTEAGIEAGEARTLPVAVSQAGPREPVRRPMAGVIPGVSPRAAHRMSSWNPTSTGPRHAR